VKNFEELKFWMDFFPSILKDPIKKNKLKKTKKQKKKTKNLKKKINKKFLL
jgi:hypothetical protein